MGRDVKKLLQGLFQHAVACHTRENPAPPNLLVSSTSCSAVPKAPTAGNINNSSCAPLRNLLTISQKRASQELDLPMEVLIIIADDVAATSFKPMEDLGNLRVVCRVMEHAWGDLSIGQHVVMLRIYTEGLEWLDPDRYYNLLALLVGVANPSAGPKKLRNNGCRVCCEEAAYLVNSVTWRMHVEPLPPALVHDDFPCARGDCGKVKGWEQATLFCNEDCRIRHEIVEFEKRMGIDQ
uniref:Uncharacterized protein n=1 Tax=Setaria italica TaxID=4555 RepID=K3ZF54_SETIT